MAEHRIEIKCRIFLIAFIILASVSDCRKTKKRRDLYGRHRSTGKPDPFTKTLCLELDNTLRAKHKSCFLRPDTGPCRADIIQWYFDVKHRECYRFFWGGCQGNGNRFESEKECLGYCFLNSSTPADKIPHFCSLAFDYGNCFGHYNRWHWDRIAKTCKRRIYSGCGGNQNNFESRHECIATCLRPPNNTLHSSHQYTTCVPYQIADVQ